MEANLVQLELSASEQLKLLVLIEAHVRRTNELLFATLNREQRQAFEAAHPDHAG
jgi:hypothetical protein